MRWPQKVRGRGADMVDSPVSGSVLTLEQGNLTMMVGGNAATFERIKPLLLDIGPKATHVGDNGLAVSMKIAVNLSLGVQMLAFSEGVLLAEKSGIARQTAVEVLTNSAMASPMVKYRGPFVLGPARGSVVRREHDAEGYDARARDGTSSGGSAADHGALSTRC